MNKHFFNDENFVEDLLMGFERVEAVAKEENRDLLEMLNTRYQDALNDIDNMFSNNANKYKLKKRKYREKAGNLPSFNATRNRARIFNKNFGFAAA